MNKSAGRRHFWAGLSPWLIIGAIVILVPIFIFMTLENIDRQKQQATRLLVEKGASLIRSFEAGARTGAGMHWGMFQLQKLLVETAQQPDIDYLIVTDDEGRILGDSDPSMVDDYYRTGLELKRISRSKEVAWRKVPNTEGADTFEVYRRFLPSDAGSGGGERAEAGPGGMIIFVGLNMGPVEEARLQDMRHTVWMAVIFLLIGFSGVVSLLLAQGYRAARSSLSRVQAFSDSLVENMPIGLVAVDGRDRIVSFNQAAEDILGHAANEIVGEKAADIMPEPCRGILETLRTQKAIVEKEIDCPAADGRTIPLEVIATTLREEGGTLIGYVILLRDLTEVRHLKSEVARSQRLASLGNLAAGVAHEIRNPLSSIKGFATYFKERYRGNQEDEKTAEIMVQEVDRLNRVISQLLEFARPLDLKRCRTSLQEVIRHTLKMVEGQAGKSGVTLRTELTGDIGEMSVDPDLIKQVLLNLCLNAITAMENGGVLSLALSMEDERTARIDVTDTGKGIAEEDLGRIFDPYFTTRPSGTGLGLAIVYKIIEAHDGEIRVSSRTGEGTAVSVFLPARGWES